MTLFQALHISRVPVLGFMAIGFYWGSFAASVPLLKARLGISDGEFGVLLLLNAVGLVIAMSSAPKLSRALRTRALQVSFILMVMVFPLSAVVPTALWFAVAMGLTGFASGLLDVLVNTRVAELEAETGESLMNANHGTFSVAYAVAALTMGGLRDGGIDPVFGFALWAILIFGATLLVRLPFKPVSTAPDVKIGFNPAILVCGCIVLIAFMTEATVETWSALHIERTLNGNPAEGALGPAMLGFTMAIGRFSGAALSARYSDLRIIAVATGISVVGCTMAALAPTAMMAYLGFGVMGLGISVIGPIGLALVGQAATEETRSAAIAQASIIGFSGFFIAPAVMGGLAEGFGLRVAYLAFAAGLFLLFPLIAFLKR